MARLWQFLIGNSLLLVLGALIALLWANMEPHSYHALIHLPLPSLGLIGEREGAERSLTLHYLVNDVLMALFFARAGKEVWEAVALREGSLRGRKAVTPLIATAGGMAGPVAVYLLIAALFGSTTFDAIAKGWAVPTATDIAFSYLVGRIVFGAGHPAIRFLLLLAIADDAGGLLILAIFYPTGALAPAWLLLSLASALLAWGLFNRLPRSLDAARGNRTASAFAARVFGVWPYVIAGVVSWFAFQEAGIHPALGLLPVIPAIPHADHDFGIFAEAEERQTDLLNRLEHALKLPVEITLFLFGLANAGVEFGAVGPATAAVLGGLLIGKPLGIALFGWIAARPLGIGLPEGMRIADLVVVGFVAAIGFTVALFVAAVAFRVTPGLAPEAAALAQGAQDGAKMGALLSFGAAILAIAAGRLLGVVRKA